MRIKTNNINRIACALVAGLTLLATTVNTTAQAAEVGTNLEESFATPPASDRPWTYWWWLNGAASKEGITRDFEEMRAKGIGGVMLLHAGEVPLDVQKGPAFMSDEWRELFRHAVQEAARCGLGMSVNLCNGWNAGGPWITREHCLKSPTSTPPVVVQGPGPVRVQLRPRNYLDVAVLAAPVVKGQEKVWDIKGAVDVTQFMNDQGLFEWEAPEGDWNIVRVGYRPALTRTAPHSKPMGFEVDPLSAEAMEFHFAHTGAKLIADAGPLVGKTLQYFHIDSYEGPMPRWTPKMPEEFLARRGYEMLPYLPSLSGWTLNDEDALERFEKDYRRTVADLWAQNYYGKLSELAIAGGLLGTDSESGGPRLTTTDALECLGREAAPMGEFWTRYTEPQGEPYLYGYNSTIKLAASAAHIYGRRISQAEAFTSLSCDFSKYPAALKDLGDWAFCQGLNRLVFHQWVHQVDPDKKPGIHWEHIGIDFGHSVTWWPLADDWLAYLTRCQHLLQQGLFVADFAYLIPEEIPTSDSSRVATNLPEGFDWDPINAEVLLTRAGAENKRLTLSTRSPELEKRSGDGMSYRYLVLPGSPDDLSEQSLAKIRELAKAGVKIIGPNSFAGHLPALHASTPSEAVEKDRLRPDVELQKLPAGAEVDWTHRRAGSTDIYFLSNQTKDLTNDIAIDALFRVSGQQPELWDPVTGETRDLPQWSEENGATRVALRFAPRQSWFVVFRNPAQPGDTTTGEANFPALKSAQAMTGPWSVQFDPEWFYPTGGLTGDAAEGRVSFPELKDWAAFSEPAIKYYSGIATYSKSFDATAESLQANAGSSATYIDLGTVHHLARVKLNGKDLGTVWTAPWRVAIPSGLLKETGNTLEIEVANNWPNRLIGDDLLEEDQGRTQTNISTYNQTVTPNGELVPTSGWARKNCPVCRGRLHGGEPETTPSGLLGPVQLIVEK